jgi:ankyrin repeat protein
MPPLPPQHAVALDGDLARVQEMMTADGALLNSRVHGRTYVDDLLADECTPLMMAGYGNAPDVVAWLVGEGAVIDRADASGCTAAHWACISNATNGLRALVAAGGDPNAPDNDGWPPLFVAIDWGAKDCARYLVSLPAFDVHRTDRTGYTALHHGKSWASWWCRG